MINQKELDDMVKILSDNNELTYCVECMHYKPSDSDSGRCLIADEEREANDFCSRGDNII